MCREGIRGASAGLYVTFSFMRHASDDNDVFYTKLE